MADLLEGIFASRTRARLIAAFAMRPGERLYLREAARLIKADVRAVKVELDRLERLGFLKRETSGNRRYMQVNQAFTLYPELKAMVIKTAGLGGSLRAALTQLSGIRFAFVYGSVAKGEETPESDLDLFIVGKVSGPLVHKALAGTKAALSREVNTSRFTLEEVQARLKKGDSFIKDVLKGPKIFIIGTEDEFTRVLGLGPS
ncbi:MAG: nucleotidyltransferase domain-containing protein [Elusimicrobiota bacterium]